MSTTSGGDGRLTKAQRKEQARLERERIQRELESRKRRRTIGIVLVAVAVAAIVAVVALLPKDSNALPAPADLLSEATAQAKAAGCSPVRTVPPYDPQSDDRTHIGSTSNITTMPPLSSYPSTPPASGPHNPVPLKAGVYDSPPPIDQVIHSLEHGASVVWYDPNVSSEQLQQIKDFYGRRISEASVGQDRVIVAPYDYPGQGKASQLPNGVQMALIAWHREQSCAQVNLASAFDFTSQYSFPTSEGRKYLGEAPEPGGVM